MHTCPWCTTEYVNWQSQCKQCGGPLPPPPGMKLGEPPPPAPRKLPSTYVKRVRWTENIATLVGLGFTGIGLLIAVPMLANKLWLPALIPGFFLLGGVSMFRHGWKSAAGRLRAFKSGKAVEGRIERVGIDASQQINGRHPSRVVYHFPIGDQWHEGQIITFDTTATLRSSGQPVWVLYNENDPNENAIYPPLS
ncbi:MAG: DUF3592 domain-containing protein [Verrucomicrobiaceae bacterium]|nr:DUF3592 domain-containing protein [Verrucomicrobiaceae bacterium]